jgi:CBS domain-containing protein
VSDVAKLLEEKGSEVLRIDAGATVFDAIRRMVDANVGALLVTDGGRVAGIVTERDYLRRVTLEGRTEEETRVREIMTTVVVTVRPDDSVELCNTLMHRHRIRHLPVVEGDRAEGMLSIRDVLAELVHEEEDRIHELETERLMIQTGSY